MQIILSSTLSCLFLQLFSTTVFAVGAPEQQCQLSKNRAAGEYAECRQNAEAKLAASGDVAQYDDRVSRCGEKLGRIWKRLEDRAVALGTACPSTEDVMSIDSKITATADTIAILVAGVRFKDNGDGTVTDHQTGLQWEKKTTVVGSGTNSADPHDVDNTYSWSVSGPPYSPDGTVFTDFLGGLNGGSYDGVMLEGCFADHCDWRLPTIVELREVMYSPYPCFTNPCIDSVFRSTSSAAHWSASTYPGVNEYAWHMDFNHGNLEFSLKGAYHFVRAVRGGS